MRNSNMAQINMKQSAGFLFAGAIVGSAIALLYAPQSGVRTRKNIKKLARETVDRLDDLQEDIRDQVSNRVNDMAEVVKDAVDRGRNSVPKATTTCYKASTTRRNTSKTEGA